MIVYHRYFNYGTLANLNLIEGTPEFFMTEVMQEKIRVAMYPEWPFSNDQQGS